MSICERCIHADVCGVTHMWSNPHCADFLGWIPVSERLPETDGEYLVTKKTYTLDGVRNTVKICTYNTEPYDPDCDFGTPYQGQGWYIEDGEYEYRCDDDILAWMPNLEPYKPESGAV